MPDPPLYAEDDSDFPTLTLASSQPKTYGPDPGWQKLALGGGLGSAPAPAQPQPAQPQPAQPQPAQAQPGKPPMVKPPEPAKPQPAKPQPAKPQPASTPSSEYPPDPTGTTDTAGSVSTGSGNLAQAAQMNVGKLNTKAMPGTKGGTLGCAGAVCSIIHGELGYPISPTTSTAQLDSELQTAGWQQVDPHTPGAVIISPTVGNNHGHTGIVGEDGKIYSNSSATGNWEQNYTVDGWEKSFADKGLQTKAYLPPSQTAQADTSTPSFAKGGIVTKPTVAMVGEKGPEAIVPLDTLSSGAFSHIRDLLEHSISLGPES